MNLYLYCAHHWNEGKVVIPQFFGFHDYPTWPLNEDYSKWTLVIFKPWRNSFDDLKHIDGTFASSLNDYMFHKDFPARKRAEILRVRLRLSGVDIDIGSDLQNHNNTEDRNVEEDTMFNEAIDSTISQNSSIGSNENVGLSENYFNLLPDRTPDNYDWAIDYASMYKDWLHKFAKHFYEEQNHNILANDSGSSLNITNVEDTFIPENCRGDSQKFIIYHNLYYQYMLFQHSLDDSNENPNQQFIFVEGKPGTGKTFVVRTLQYINSVIHKSKLCVLSSAPTGCASALIKGSTHFRVCKIPTGFKFHKAPSNLKLSSNSELKALKKRMTSTVCRIMDEHSQTGRPFWAWLKNRHEYFRRPQIIRNEDNHIIIDESLNFPLSPEIYNRPWGGIPFIYSFGDCCQLPPVKMKAIYDDSCGKPDSSDNIGRIAFNDFVNADHIETTDSVVVKMDYVLRQENPIFLKLLHNIRHGTMDDDDTDLLLSRCLDNLSSEEKDKFKNAIHLVPVWNMTDKIVYEYLVNLTSPIIKIRPIYSSIRASGENHCVSECSYPTKVALCEGAVVMLLRNFIVEYNIMNGSIGIIRKIVYEEHDGPKNSTNVLPSYVIVEFKNVVIPEENKAFPEHPNNWIPIPVITQHCEKRCCNVTTIPLRVCVALTIHKSQGMTIGPGENFEHAVVYLPDKSKNQKSTAGLELVGISRVTSPEFLAIGNDSKSLCIANLKKIGISKTNDNIRTFHKYVEKRSSCTCKIVRDHISSLDNVSGSEEERTYENGCNYLLSWFNSLK